MKKNPVVHFEMPAKDKKRVAKFYESAFGWGMQQLGPEMGEYVLATTSPMDKNNMYIEKGAINGGKISDKQKDIPGIGKFVMFEDTEGNRVGMLQPTR